MQERILTVKLELGFLKGLIFIFFIFYFNFNFFESLYFSIAIWLVGVCGRLCLARESIKERAALARAGS